MSNNPSPRPEGIMLLARLHLSFALSFVAIAGPAFADEPTAKIVTFHGYQEAIELKQGAIRAVFCPQAGGRVLSFSVDGKEALYLDDADRNWQPGKPGPSSAGRFDYGPELTVPAHPVIWSGAWSSEI